MKAYQPYLNFDGTAKEAMTFYQQCLGGELSIQTFGDVNAPFPGAENRVMHARLDNGPAFLMASDSMPGTGVIQGNNVHVNIDCGTLEEIEKFFPALAEGGTVTMPLDNTFWGARFGMLTDKFGIHWMMNYELPKNG